MRSVLAFVICLFSSPALADVVVPTKIIRARELLVPSDFQVKAASLPGTISSLEALSGMEARSVLYPGRPVRDTDIGLPAVVERNDLITLIFDQGGLRITTDGRALGRGAVGDMIKVMNLSSRTTLTGRIEESGVVRAQ